MKLFSSKLLGQVVEEVVCDVVRVISDNKNMIAVFNKTFIFLRLSSFLFFLLCTLSLFSKFYLYLYFFTTFYVFSSRIPTRFYVWKVLKPHLFPEYDFKNNWNYSSSFIYYATASYSLFTQSYNRTSAANWFSDKLVQKTDSIQYHLARTKNHRLRFESQTGTRLGKLCQNPSKSHLQKIRLR